jgi:hypothetical protein
MSVKRVIVELRHNSDLENMAFAAGASAAMELNVSAVPAIGGLKFDTGFIPVALPGKTARSQLKGLFSNSLDPHDTAPLFDVALGPKESTYIVRGEADEAHLAEIAKHKAVVGVYSDPVIEPITTCGNSGPVGTDADVERILCVDKLKSCGMDGFGVLVAIVDTGINIAYLNNHGKTPHFDPTRSWVPQSGLIPGSLPVNHGTMCAYDACIAAPQCTLLDIAVLASTATGPTIMSGLLSDAVRAYSFLLSLMIVNKPPTLVVSNSWGMFNPSWDFPAGNPGNYSDNPNHPFNKIVASLEVAGADILFAAGNCGPTCPDGRCQGATSNCIYGANSSASVLCVAGVDINNQLVGYSSVGPGRLVRQKPDICGYTHFRGSGALGQVDGGTSAATPVVAGVVAAVRSKQPYDPANSITKPAAIRSLMTSTAQDLGPIGYDFQYGYGVASGCNLHSKLCQAPLNNICKRYPWLPMCRSSLCKKYPWLPQCRFDICKQHPEICKKFPIDPLPPGPQSGFTTESNELTSEDIQSSVGTHPEDGDLIETSFLAGYDEGLRAAAEGRSKI